MIQLIQKGLEGYFMNHRSSAESVHAESMLQFWSWHTCHQTSLPVFHRVSTLFRADWFSYVKQMPSQQKKIFTLVFLRNRLVRTHWKSTWCEMINSMLVLWTYFKTSKGSQSCSKKRKENDHRRQELWPKWRMIFGGRTRCRLRLPFLSQNTL